MNQLQELQIYYLQLEKEEKEHIIFKPKDEEIYEEEKSNEINSEQNEKERKIKAKKATIKRLNSLPKRYNTYPLDFKKKLVMEVNKLIFLLLLFFIFRFSLIKI